MINKIAVIFFVLLMPAFALAATTGIQVNLGVDGTCNNNGACEPPGETASSCAADCASASPSSGSTTTKSGSVALSIYGLSVDTENDSATIRWNTTSPTLSSVRWGETSEVKAGTLNNILFIKRHAVAISGLKSGTPYYFTIEGRDLMGRAVATTPSYFFTKFLIDTAYPLPPRNLSSFSGEQGISIYWQNPPDPSFAYVRIMRHDDRLRGDPYTGKLVYEGTGESFLDKDVVAGKKYFYSLFARDRDGRYSAGTGISAVARSPQQEPDALPLPPRIDKAPLLQNFFVYQYNKEIFPLVGLIPESLSASQNIIVYSDQKISPDDWLEVKDDSGRKLSVHLFTFNTNSGRYQTVVPPLSASGKYKLTVLRYISGQITIISEALLETIQEDTVTRIPAVPDEETTSSRPENSLFSWVWLPLLALFFFIFLLARRRKKSQKP